jgi:hypothetical protein
MPWEDEFGASQWKDDGVSGQAYDRGALDQAEADARIIVEFRMDLDHALWLLRFYRTVAWFSTICAIVLGVVIYITWLKFGRII